MTELNEVLFKYEPIIGLEVHAQLSTKTKMFCRCSTSYGAPPNTHICPVCLGMPGALPVANLQAVNYSIRTALALECTICATSVWSRKNYFYPDLPKGYQITQYDKPLAINGRIVIDTKDGEKHIGITRIHMEEDAGKNTHVTRKDQTLVDFNRCGVPLIEIVSEPDIQNSDQGVSYLKALRSILIAIGVCDGNMEQGSLRCDANISIRPIGSKKFGTRIELKNMNSFHFLHEALDYEIIRQAGLLSQGHTVAQETRLYDSRKGITLPMRSKEEAHDYRYFPEPDLPVIQINNAWIEAEKSKLPELPRAKSVRLQKQYGLSPYDAGVLVADAALAHFYEQALNIYYSPKKIANWIINEVLRESKDEVLANMPIGPQHIAQLVKLVDNGAISSKMAKQVFADMVCTGKLPEQVIKDKGWKQVTDQSELEAIVDNVISAHEKEVQRYRSGKKGLIGFFVGEAMKATAGRADPKLLNLLLRKKLG